MISQKKKLEALQMLKTYEGKNPYIYMIKRDVITKQDINAFGDFQAEYVLTNYDKDPVIINKSTKIPDWYGQKLKEEYGLEFQPKIIVIKSYLGETHSTYNCYIKYRKNMDPIMKFLPKNAVLNNFLAEDYTKKIIDFDKYDTITTRKDPNRKLKDHQKEAVKFLLSRKKCILADDPGMGKTTSLVVAALEGQFERVLIICPASIKTTWKRELGWYVDPAQISIIEGFQSKTKKELEKFLGYPEGKSGKTVAELKEEAMEKGKWKDNRFTIVNYDILDEFYKIPQTRSAENVQKAFEQSPMLQFIANHYSLVIIDEAHRLSNSTSIRFKVIRDLLRRGNPGAVYEVTGTPITNRPLNLYNVLSFLEDPITDNWEEYVKRYCNGFQIPAKGEKERYTNIFCAKYKIPNKYAMTYKQQEDCKAFVRDNAKMIWITNGESNLDELKERVSHIYLRRTKDDLPGMVNKNIHEMFYDLTEPQWEKYCQLWDEYEQEKLSLNPDSELNKDLIEGGIYRRYLSNEMVPHTIELVEDLLESGRKVVVGCCYDEELYNLQKHFDKRCVIYNGKMDAKHKDLAMTKFMEDKDIVVFVANINAAGLGLTLTAADALVFNNISFVPADNLQFQDRVHRISSTNDVDIFYQIFRGTQYERMWNIVLRKSLVIEKVIKKEEDK